MADPYDNFSGASLNGKWVYIESDGTGSAYISNGECVIPLTYSSGSAALNGIFVDNVSFPIDIYVKLRGPEYDVTEDAQRAQMLIGAAGDNWVSGYVQVVHKRNGHNTRVDNGASGAASISTTYSPIFWHINIASNGDIVISYKTSVGGEWIVLQPLGAEFTLAGETECQLLFGSQVLSTSLNTTSWYDWIRATPPETFVRNSWDRFYSWRGFSRW